MKNFTNTFTSDGDSKSETAKWMRHELWRRRLDGTILDLFLQLDLAILMEIGKHMNKVAYTREGDGPLVKRVFSFAAWPTPVVL